MRRALNWLVMLCGRVAIAVLLTALLTLLVPSLAAMTIVTLWYLAIIRPTFQWKGKA